MCDAIGAGPSAVTAEVKHEDDGDVPFQTVGFVKQEVFDSDFDGISSRDDRQAEATSSAIPESNGPATSREPFGPQEASTRVDLAIVKTEVLCIPYLRRFLFGSKLDVNGIAGKLYLGCLFYEDIYRQGLFL